MGKWKAKDCKKERKRRRALGIANGNYVPAPVIPKKRPVHVGPILDYEKYLVSK